MLRRAVNISIARGRMALMSYATLPDLLKPSGAPAELPKLGFNWKDGCAPVFSPRQMELHYTKHHKAYVDKLNALAGTTYDGKSIEEIILAVANDAEKKGLFNQAAQHFNHTFYFRCITPNGKAMPKSFESAVTAQFGSVEQFKDAFVQAGVNNFGSGWTWLCVDPSNKNQLVIDNTSNAGCPLTKGLRPVLAVDVWEHAYYKDFENRRPDYLKEIWSVIDWEFVAKMHVQAIK
ncbi:iron superoxide dismutase A, mitochondrial [Trypanosoma cruzi]|uniref:Superoxide dismutase n=4 Tax=Trypanosoma cruzi TaxID=5693 RepID=Q4D9I5_TRYCC|nr:iron superoxide dismutase, putative [Trypanosoma cruzi]EAN89187.1 iron superoxide dismutase, putative [Trypanosoma cruzi]PWV02173.1 iron superoxide dismutase A, mitochondrial [Trypanosoma cruzi]RNC43040.1 iron superoxide dismutase [Trypanosoma cruzi]USU43637.1 putative iron superoxide dismutase [Trypanosoma cruzi]|eukprot:XP_811038.1 iron superoxide dismutase [Trypanosoma cruzi strain CL Brener]